MKKTVVVFFFLIVPAAVNFSYSQLWKIYSDSARVFADQRIQDKALNNYLKAKDIIPGDSVFTDTYIQILKNIALLYYGTKQQKQALTTAENLLPIISTVHTEMNVDYALMCNLTAVIYQNSGKLDSAKIFHLKAKNIREKLPGTNRAAYAQSCNNLGALYRDFGQYELAEPLLLEAKEIREKLTPQKQQDPYAITCNSLANLYRDLGQYEKAEQFYLLAKERRSISGKDNSEYANSCNVLADLYSYSYMGQPEKAEALYLEAKDIREKLDSGSYEFGQSCNNLASLYKDMKQFDKAEPLALIAKDIYEKELEEGHPSITINLNIIGELYYAMGKYKESEQFFLKARERWEEDLGKDHPYFIANTEEMARLYRDMNETAKADKLFSDMLDSKYKQLNKIFTFTNENEKQLYLKNINGPNDEYLAFCYRKIPHNAAGQSYAMSLLYRNLILSSAQQLRQVIYNSRDTSLTKTYAEWTTLKKQLAHLYGQGADANTEIEESLENKADSIEKILSRRSAVFGEIQKKISWQDIRQKLKSNEAAVEFVEFSLDNNDNPADSVLYVAIILKKTMKQPLLLPLFEKKQLNVLIEQSPDDEAGMINQLYSSTALFELIWKPLEKHLTGVSKVYYAPSGNLFRVSFGAMPANNRQLLGDKYQLIQLNTTAAVINPLQNYISPSDKIQLYGGIDYDADTAALKKVTAKYHNNKDRGDSLPGGMTRGKVFKYLPGTKEEVNEIKKQATKAGTKATLLSDVDATKESFFSLNGSLSPSVLHIATHGFFFDDADTLTGFQRDLVTSGKIFRESNNPLYRTGLLFAGGNNIWRGKTSKGIENGIVTAYEISSAMYLPNTKLVVLSACETARGHIEGSEGVYGLQRAFKIAGAQNLVMSLWKVPDAETSAFMQTFYRNMFSKQSVSDAFYNAQNTMKMKYRNDPYKWAAWVLVR